MKPLWIELVETGVGNRYELEDHESIELNWRLTMYPELYSRVLQHELKHDEGNYSLQDAVHDFKSRTPGLFKFMGNHLSAWTQILPFYWSFRHKKFIYDWSTIFSWLMMFAMAYTIYWLLSFGSSLL